MSRLDVRFRPPVGSDDLAFLEATGNMVERALGALARLARTLDPANGEGAGEDIVAGGNVVRWAQLTVTDFEAALLGLRCYLFGDELTCVTRCTEAACGARMEFALSIAAFLADVRPKSPRLVARSETDPEWFGFADGDAPALRFRLPRVADQIAVLGRPHARALLAARCVHPPPAAARGLARVERAMQSLAPAVSRPVTGRCAECGARVTLPLHVPKVVMAELSNAASGVHEDIDTIAATYHWDESVILALPQTRRRAYADTIERRKRVSS